MICRSAIVRFYALDVTLTVIFIANIFFLKLQVCDWFRVPGKVPENAKNMFEKLKEKLFNVLITPTLS